MAAPTKTTAPSGSITAVKRDAGQTVTGKAINDKTLTLTGAATAGSTVKIYDNGALIGTITAAADGTWTYLTPSLGEGLNTFTATITSGTTTVNAAGSVAVTVDTVGPDTTIVSAPPSVSTS